MSPDPEEKPARAHEPASPGTPPTFRSNDILQGGKEAFILHGTQTYRLRLTRSDKLILQK